jgi:thioredoxin reductase (NADPH)
MYQNEETIVVGGGDSAFQEALVLAQYCRRVLLVHRGDTFRASTHFVEQVKANEKITLVCNATIKAILGGKMVEKAQVKHADGRVEDTPCAGVFAYIGLEPNTDFLPQAVERDAAGLVRTDDAFQTALPGVTAIGAVRSSYKGTLDDALDEAQRAVTAIRARLT